MRLLRFGLTVVNMDRVNSISFSANDRLIAHLYHSAPYAPNGIESIQPDYTRLEGSDAEALQRWLYINSEDITLAPPATDLENDNDSRDLPV
jgi:hypothetical protein